MTLDEGRVGNGWLGLLITLLILLNLGAYAFTFVVANTLQGAVSANTAQLAKIAQRFDDLGKQGK